jgi:hypothetical protein
VHYIREEPLTEFGNLYGGVSRHWRLNTQRRLILLGPQMSIWTNTTYNHETEQTLHTPTASYSVKPPPCVLLTDVRIAFGFRLSSLPYKCLCFYDI